MFRPFARPSRTRDAIGAAVLAATAILYALGGGRAAEATSSPAILDAAVDELQERETSLGAQAREVC